MGKAVPLTTVNAVKKNMNLRKKVALFMRVRLIEASKIFVKIRDVSA